MVKRLLTTAVVTLLVCNAPHAQVHVVSGAKAQNKYLNTSKDVKILSQKGKMFYLKIDDMTENINKKQINLKVNETLFIVNDEKKHVHNLYDEKDKSWVIKKQHPSEVSAVRFDLPGEHEFRCAIHPRMKVKVSVK